MSERYSRLPLRSLTVFEAAARHRKFAAAAHELSMTQAGVSQHVSQLEADLGVTLFTRQHRGVSLTAVGETLLESVEQGLRTLADGVASARRTRQDRTLRILTDFGFAAWWLMPRIAALSELMPDVEVRLITTQSEIEAAEGEFDLAILFGAGDWAGCRSTLLFQEEVYPVCSPSFLGGRPVPQSPAEIAQLRLLHLRSIGPRRWFSWDDWFAAQQTPPPSAPQELTFNNYQLVLQAALLGQGVGLGWTPLIDSLVRDGNLIRLTEKPLRSARGYHLVEPARPQPSPFVEPLRAWLDHERSAPAAAPLRAEALPITA